jgi:hypothetical protein
MTDMGSETFSGDHCFMTTNQSSVSYVFLGNIHMTSITSLLFCSFRIERGSIILR